MYEYLELNKKVCGIKLGWVYEKEMILYGFER